MNRDPELEYLRNRLREDTDSLDEMESLLPTVARLASWKTPTPTPAETVALLAKLEASLPPEPIRTRLDRLNDWPPLLLLQSQLRVVKREIWLASLLVMLLGVVVTLILAGTHTMGIEFPILLVAPLVAAIGLSFLYNPDSIALLELERTMPMSQVLILLARLALVFGFDLLIGLSWSILITLIRPELSLWVVIGAWLAPMAFLSGIAFLLSVIFIDPLVGALIGFALWIGLISFRFWNSELLANLPIRIFDPLDSNNQGWFLVLAIPLFMIGFWISIHREVQADRTL